MYGIIDPLTFLIGTILVVLLPGPNSLFVLAVASSRGVGAGYRAAMGVFSGDLLLILATAMGAASVLLANPMLFTILKYAGAAYLAYLGCNLLRKTWQHLRNTHSMQTVDRNASTVPRVSVTMSHPFRRALFVSLINPKAIFFFMSFFVQFVDMTYPHPALTFLLLGIIVQVCSLLYLSCLIFAGSRLAGLIRSHPHVCALGNASVGALFIGFGFRLADATLNS